MYTPSMEKGWTLAIRQEIDTKLQSGLGNPTRTTQMVIHSVGGGKKWVHIYIVPPLLCEIECMLKMEHGRCELRIEDYNLRAIAYI